LRTSTSPGLNVACGHNARSLLAHNHALGAFAFHADGDFLDVENDVGDIFTNTGDRRELMKNAVDLYRGHGSTLQRRQQDAAQRVAQGQAIATLERLGNNGRQEARVITRLDLEFGRLDKFLPVF
jgi:hypothetical protein